MATITFRTKPYDAEGAVYTDDAPDPHKRVSVPELTRKHCDMDAFRRHPKYTSYANSDLFQNILVGIRRKVAPNGYLRLDRLPEGVSVDASGFLAKVTIEV